MLKELWFFLRAGVLEGTTLLLFELLGSTAGVELDGPSGPAWADFCWWYLLDLKLWLGIPYWIGLCSSNFLPSRMSLLESRTSGFDVLLLAPAFRPLSRS